MSAELSQSSTVSRPGLEPSRLSDGPAAYRVRRLTLSDFRCYGHLTLGLEAGPVVFSGPNGSGKTNILEAVSYLVPGRGLRGARLGEVTRRQAVTSGPGAWAVAATVETSEGTIKTGTGLEVRPTSPDEADGKGEAVRERRVVKINGEPAGGTAALAGLMRISWLLPQMDRLFQESPSGRRRFLDRLVAGHDTSHGRRVNAFERAMRERNRLLHDQGAGADPKWLVALETTMAEHGVAIAAARREVVARLGEVLLQSAGPFPAAGLGLRGELEDCLEATSALEAEDRYCKILADGRGRDALAGGTAAGPHKSDLVVSYGFEGLPAAQCSTGEQKALLISIVLADARLHQALGNGVPLLLLDEVVAHLDEERRQGLFEAISDLGAQAWMTGTDRALFEPMIEQMAGQAQFFDVDAGTVTGP